MKLLLLPSLAALAALAPGDAIALLRSSSPGPSTSLQMLRSPGDPVSVVQKLLDEKCQDLMLEACKNGHPSLCVGSHTVARFDMGLSTQRNKEWRCFANSALDWEKIEGGCVDNCGAAVNCKGAVPNESVDHTTRPEVLTALLKNLVAEHCKESHANSKLAPVSALQLLLDAFCIKRVAGFCKTDQHWCRYAVARRDRGRKDQGIQWRCYIVEFLNYNIDSDGCVDDCGKFTSCPGGVSAKESIEHHTLDRDFTKFVMANAEITCNLQELAPSK